MSHTPTEWRLELVSDAARVVTGTGRQKLILARCATKQLPETETVRNAQLMATADQMRIEAIQVIEDLAALKQEQR